MGKFGLPAHPAKGSTRMHTRTSYFLVFLFAQVNDYANMQILLVFKANASKEEKNKHIVRVQRPASAFLCTALCFGFPLSVCREAQVVE